MSCGCWAQYCCRYKGASSEGKRTKVPPTPSTRRFWEGGIHDVGVPLQGPFCLLITSYWNQILNIVIRSHMTLKSFEGRYVGSPAMHLLLLCFCFEISKPIFLRHHQGNYRLEEENGRGSGASFPQGHYNEREGASPLPAHTRDGHNGHICLWSWFEQPEPYGPQRMVLDPSPKTRGGAFQHPHPSVPLWCVWAWAHYPHFLSVLCPSVSCKDRCLETCWELGWGTKACLLPKQWSNLLVPTPGCSVGWWQLML